MIRHVGQEVSDLIEAAFFVRCNVVYDTIRAMNSRSTESVEAEILLKGCCLDDLRTSVEETSDICCYNGEMRNSCSCCP